MSDLRINNITDRTGDSGPVFAGISTVSTTGAFTVPVGPTEYRGGRGRGLIAGGRKSPTYYNTINYVEISTTGNSVDFGDLLRQVNGPKGTSNSIRACFASGYHDPSSGYTNNIDYVTISSQGGAADFGDLTTGANGSFGTASNNTRGLYIGGSPSYLRTCQYITFATTGDANNFGDMLPNTDKGGMRNSNSGVLGSATRAIFAGGDTPNTGDYRIIQYTEYASLGDTIKFGELSATWTNSSAVSSGTRGVIMGGENPSRTNACEYITIATFGNGTDFGDLTDDRRSAGAFDNSVRGCLAGGDDSGSGGNNSNIIDYITIATTGNATDFGDIYAEVRNPGTGSDCHGGLG